MISNHSGGAPVKNQMSSLQIFVYVFTLYFVKMDDAKNLKHHFGGSCVALATDSTLTT